MINNDLNNTVTKSQYHNEEEYSALRNEITARIQMVSSMGFSMVTAMLSIWLISVTLLIGTLNHPNIPFWAVYVCNLILVAIYLCLSISIAFKIGENLRQITLLAAYLREFHENEVTKRSWEKTQNHSIVGLENLPRSSKKLNLYYFEALLLPISAIAGYFINWICLYNDACDHQCLLSITLCLFIIATSFTLVSVWGKISIIKNMRKFGERSEVKLRFLHDSEKPENQPEEGSEIPRIIHYFWLGGQELPRKFEKKYKKSWLKQCGEKYEILLWTDTDFDFSALPNYVQQAYENKKYAFVSDYLRLLILYRIGGIYLDTDIILKKTLEPLRAGYRGFIGFDFDEKQLGTACFGIEKHNATIKEIMDLYEKLDFERKDGSLFLLANTFIYSSVFLQKGLVPNNQWQFVDGIAVFPKDYFCANGFPLKKHRIPLMFSKHFRRKQKTSNTFAIHDFGLSWIKGCEQEYRDLESKWVEEINDMAGLEKGERMRANF